MTYKRHEERRLRLHQKRLEKFPEPEPIPDYELVEERRYLKRVGVKYHAFCFICWLISLPFQLAIFMGKRVGLVWAHSLTRYPFIFISIVCFSFLIGSLL